VLIGVVVALAKTAWDLSHLEVNIQREGGTVRVRLAGHATFLRVPRLNHALDTLPEAENVHLDVTDLTHYDRSCQETVREWITRQEARGRRITVTAGTGRPRQAELAR
jgi:MFS superfamily sulfate permease-like transporter